MFCQLDASEFINPRPIHCTKITRFDVHHRFGVNCAIGKNQTHKKPLPHVGKMEVLGNCWALKTVQPIILIELYMNSRLSSMRQPQLKAVGWSYSVHSWHGPRKNTRRHIYLPWLCSEGSQMCKSKCLSPHWCKLWPHKNLKKKANTILPT